MLKKYKIEPKSCIYVIATYLCSWGMAYLLEEFVRLSAIFKLEIFAERIDIDNPLVWEITFEICFLIAFIISHIIFSILYKSRRKAFIEDTKGLITKKDGLVYHIKRYWFNDVIVLSIQAVLFVILFLIKPTLSPIAIIYRLCGVPLGVIVSALALAVIYVNHILWAQYHWRVKHYMHE